MTETGFQITLSEVSFSRRKILDRDRFRDGLNRINSSFCSCLPVLSTKKKLLNLEFHAKQKIEKKFSDVFER